MTDRFKKITATNSSSPLLNSKTGPAKDKYELRQSPFWSAWSNDNRPISLPSLIDSIDTENAQILVTHGEKAVIYNYRAGKPARLFACFELGTNRVRRKAYGARFGREGSLIAVGSDDGHCRLYTVEEYGRKYPTRELRDVSLKVGTHRCAFISETQLLTAYDNGFMRLFDLYRTNVIHAFNDLHSDHIRALAVSPNLQYCLTGSYDRSSVLLDCRLFGQPSSVVAKFQCDAEPVLEVSFDNRAEKVLMASGYQVQVFDMRKMQSPLFRLDCHHGTVLSLRCLSFNGTEYLLAGGMDNMLQFYELNQGNHVHTVRMETAITAIGADCKNPGFISIGCEDGEIEFLSKRPELKSEKPKMRSFEYKLKKFQLRDAMQEVLKDESSYEDFIDCLSELITSNLIANAMKCVDMDRFLYVLAETMAELPGNADILITVASHALEAIIKGEVTCTQKNFDYLRKTLDDELELQANLLRIQGLIEIKGGKD